MSLRALLILLLSVPLWAGAQQLNNLRAKRVVVLTDTLTLDTLSMVPGSVLLQRADGQVPDAATFAIDYLSGRLIVPPTWRGDTLVVRYRVLPLSLGKVYVSRPRQVQLPTAKGQPEPLIFTIADRPPEELFDLGSLNKSGSISRGLTVGNNQDLGVTSSLNLQLSGQISQKLGIRAVITDNNIPFQPDGNTQQLQDFDQVYIQLFTDKTTLTAGDFQLRRPERSYFLSFFKRAQGLSIAHQFDMGKKQPDGKPRATLAATGSGAVSRGKFNRQPIQGIEGNQGPYRLKGAENEPYIIVLAGTERVYIDGVLLTRGQENDYVINYNSAELTFTAKRLITKDIRIIVEFQYTDRTYSRSVFHVGTDLQRDKLAVRFNLYSEQDSKSSQLAGGLSPSQLSILQDIGDSLDAAVVPTIDSVAFSTNEVLYRKADTVVTVQGAPVAIPDIFIYSVNPDSAHYRVTFSDVGLGNGNYNAVSSAANGRVYQWVAPDPTTGRPTGQYEPVGKLVTPKMNQLYTLGVDYTFSPNAKLSIEGALSNNDLNRFSSRDSQDDLGHGVKLTYDHRVPLDTGKTWVIKTGVDLENTGRTFAPIERFRSVEFDRDWNIRTLATSADQYIGSARLGFSRKGWGDVDYTFRSFVMKDVFTAWQHGLSSAIDNTKWVMQFNGSHIMADGATHLRYGRFLMDTKYRFKFMTIGLRDDFEHNTQHTDSTGAMLATSYFFNDAKLSIGLPDTWANRVSVFYQRRDEALPRNGDLTRATLGQSAGLTAEVMKDPRHQLRATMAFRNLQILDSIASAQKPDNTLINRIEYNLRVLKGTISSSTFYEVGSGLESRKEFQYVEVNPGQGAYSWIDQNDNGIKELNEYVQAVFQDTARYIRVFIPTTAFMKVYSTQFSESFNIDPRAAWGSAKGWKKVLAMFSDQLVYRVERKTQRDDLLQALDPFFGTIEDSTLVTLSQNLRNTFFFNRSSNKIAADYTYQDNRQKTFLANGFETRTLQSHTGKVRWNITRQVSFNVEYEHGWKANISEFFELNNYAITYFRIEPKLSYQPGAKLRLSLQGRYTDRLNTTGVDSAQRAVLRDIGTEARYNILEKGSIQAGFNFISITYGGSTGSTVEFEMLDGLRTGFNYTWNALFQWKLAKNIQINLTYNGRKSGDNPPVHTGSMQVRAFF